MAVSGVELLLKVCCDSISEQTDKKKLMVDLLSEILTYFLSPNATLRDNVRQTRIRRDGK